MKAHSIFVAILFLGVVWCKDEVNNELQPPPNLDERLKKALLKALSELEQEDQSKENSYSEEEASAESLEYSDREVERVPASAVLVSQSTTTSAPQSSSEEEETERSVVIIQRSKGYQEPTSQAILTNARFPEPLNETDQVLASSNSFAPLKNVAGKFKSGPNSVSTDYEKNFGSTKKTETTTSIPTTTTEENQAKVEDLQFFSAPLVTAFTVHQDEAGFPKSVIPIYKPTQNPASAPQPTADELYRQHLLQKQKQLELQLQQLQQQQKQQQEYLFRQQQILLQQQNVKQLEEQLRLQKNEQPFRPIINNNQFNNNNNQFAQLQNTAKLNNNNNQFSQTTHQLQNTAKLNNNQFTQTAKLQNTANLNNNQFTQTAQLQNAANLNNNIKLNQNKQKASDITFQPSISFTPTTTQHIQHNLPGTQSINLQQSENFAHLTFLQPPTKNPIDFNTNVYNKQSFQQIPAISQPPRVITSIQSPITQNNNVNFQGLPNPIQNIPFKQPPTNFNNQQPFQTNYFPNKQNAFTSSQNLLQNNQNAFPVNNINQFNSKNRFHRHETGTGNFGTNTINHQAIFQQHQNYIEPQQQTPTRFFRSNYENYYNVNQFRNPLVNQQLNNLFQQSGLTNTRQYEDLNIISKVLSLNHFGNDNAFSQSRYAEQRVPAPYKYS